MVLTRIDQTTFRWLQKRWPGTACTQSLEDCEAIRGHTIFVVDPHPTTLLVR